MTTSHSDDPAGDEFGDLRAGLEQLAQDLDRQAYPGRTWPPAARPASRRRQTRMALLGVAVAATLAGVLVYHATTAPPFGDPAPEVSQATHTSPALVTTHDASHSAPAKHDLPGRALPQVVIIEDLDSYSLMDLTTGVPLVSFASKNLCGATDALPALPEPALPGSL